jgi:hypothetical protein
LDFEGFLAFKPNASSLTDIISKHDLNCAVSSPNAVYGTRHNSKPPSIPDITLAEHSGFSSFTLLSVRIKALNMPPLGYTKVALRGVRQTGLPLDWSVDFPHGFHDMLHVKIEEFSGTSWSGLQSLSITADFVNEGSYMDWEYCLDDLEVILEP